MGWERYGYTSEGYTPTRLYFALGGMILVTLLLGYLMFGLRGAAGVGVILAIIFAIVLLCLKSRGGVGE